MNNKIKINSYADSIEIWILKFNILSSLVQLHLKQSLHILFQVNVFTLGISLFSFTYYISFFDSDVKFKKLANFVHKNIPGVYLTSTTVSWQTFQKTSFLPRLPIIETPETYLIKGEKTFSSNILENMLFSNVVDSIHYWGDHLQLRFNSKWNSYKKQYFFGLKVPPKQQNFLKPRMLSSFVGRDNITSSYYQCFFLTNSIQKQFYQLDEFPLNLHQIQQQSSENTLDLGTQLYNQKIYTDKDILKNSQVSKNHVFYQSNPIIGVLNGIQNIEVGNEKQLTNNLIKVVQLNETYLKWKTLQAQINQFFYKKNYFSLTGTFEFLTRQPTFNVLLNQSSFSNVASSQILFFLDKIDPKKPIPAYSDKTVKFLTNREMSGFIYPDIPTEQIMGLYQRLKYYTKLPQFGLFKKTNKYFQINIQLGSHFAYPVYHDDTHTILPKLQFKYSPIRLDAPDGKLHYSGPGVLTDLEKLDKLTYNFEDIQQQLESKLTPNSPNQKNLFRSFVKEPMNFKVLVGNSTLSETLNLVFSEAKTRQYYQKFSEVKELSSERQPINNHIDFKSEYIVPKLQNYKNWFDKSTSPLLIKMRVSNSFPIRKISFITTAKPYISLDNLDYQNPISSLRDHFLLNTKNNFKLEFHEGIQQQSSLPIKLTRTTLENIGYFKKFQPYLEFHSDSTGLTRFKKFDGLNKNQRDEPIHEQSWLMINQYLLALFIVYILRQLTKEYGRELVSYLVDLISSLGILDESFKEELTGDSSSLGYRLITDSQKRFKDIAGIDHIFSALSEVIWFLRNSGRSFNISNIVSKGILLVGPPGTGKTLLVQTIAGEAQVPVLVQSASALTSVDGFGAQRLQNLFEKAKELSPCVIFFDEIDSIGERRMHIIDDTTQTSKLISIICSTRLADNSISNSVVPFNSNVIDPNNAEKISENIPEGEIPSNGTSSEQLGLLMQLLIELDGLQSARQVVIIGATNRPNVLDPALTRPGRLDTIFRLGLPNKEKRIEICQLYSKILGSNSNITWDYIGNKTVGLSGSDLAAIINQSAIQAILEKTTHTMETLDQAIDKITGDSTLNNNPNWDTLSENFSNTHSFALSRSAYYYSGLAISHLLLPELKTMISCSLFPIEKNERYIRMVNKFSHSKLSQTKKPQLEAQLISIYAGKMSEILYLGQNTCDLSLSLAQSDLGKNELTNGTNLIYRLLNCWFLYSRNQMNDPLFYCAENRNREEVLDSNVFSFLNELLELNTLKSLQLEKSKYQNFQRWTTKSWWQSQITDENASFNTIYADWYRIHVTNPDETETNDEWIPPDRYFHSNETYLLTRTISFNNFYKMRRDFIYQSILEKAVLNAFSLLNGTSEFNDFFVMTLLQKSQLKEHEMNFIYSRFMRL